MSSRVSPKEVGQCSYRVAKQLQQGLPRELIHTRLLNPSTSNDVGGHHRSMRWRSRHSVQPTGARATAAGSGYRRARCANNSQAAHRARSSRRALARSGASHLGHHHLEATARCDADAASVYVARAPERQEADRRRTYWRRPGRCEAGAPSAFAITGNHTHAACSATAGHPDYVRTASERPGRPAPAHAPAGPCPGAWPASAAATGGHCAEPITAQPHPALALRAAPTTVPRPPPGGLIAVPCPAPLPGPLLLTAAGLREEARRAAQQHPRLTRQVIRQRAAAGARRLMALGAASQAQAGSVRHATTTTPTPSAAVTR